MATVMGRTGFRAYMPDGESYGYIAFYKWALVLAKTNVRRVKCSNCFEKIEAGAGVWHRIYGGNGYVCLDCAKKMILKYGRNGYSENILFNLQSAHFSTGKFTAQEVVDGIAPMAAAPLSAITPTFPQMDPQRTGAGEHKMGREVLAA
jgi:hypothetical protein